MNLVEYQQRANLHRPTDPAVFAAEIHRLSANGLKPRDIASALRIGLDVVLNALATHSDH